MKIVVFQGAKKQWFWHFESRGRITADAESFPSKAHAIRAAKGVVRAVGRRLPFIPVFFTVVAPHGCVITWKWD